VGSQSNVLLSFRDERRSHQVPRSGNVGEDFRQEAQAARGCLGWARTLKGALFVLASMTMNLPPPPALFDKRLETSTILRLFAPARRRPITLAEARRIALSVLADAEDRRYQFSSEEAKPLAAWEQDA
jgi:hypothetical protein